MVTEENISRLRELLLERRRSLFQLRRGVNESWQDVQEPEIEWEETATKDRMAQRYASLDDQDKEELEQIDSALRRIQEETYGVCETCGRKIPLKRLEAIPWTNLCIRCATGAGRGRPVAGEPEGISARAEDLPPDYQGMTDDELRELIMDELRVDGRIELDELQISVDDGVLSLNGVLPSETKHHMLIEILEDTLGIQKVVDHIRVDEILWEREDRVPDERGERGSGSEKLFQGEGPEDGEDGTSVQPADELVPEREE